MNNSTKPQYAEIEYPFPQADLPVIHCPLCGMGTHDVHEDGSSELTPCLHLAFIFIGDPFTFAYKSEEFEQKVTGKDLKKLSFVKFKKFLQSIGYDNKFLALEISHGGMGGQGTPIWYTDIYGFDYGVVE
ncbi:MAG: hypothetical protein NTU98_08285 [Bacteroidetes bacterium]|nr:hypothetical protein [Bacteroidota bacterium]